MQLYNVASPLSIYASFAAAAKALAEMNVSEEDGFRIKERDDGRCMIESFDPEDGFHLGYV